MDRRLYGRRRGRPLRATRARLLLDRLPGIAIHPPAAGSAIDLLELFGAGKTCHALEIGFGGGEHLAARVLADPKCGYIGVDFFQNGIANLLTLLDGAIHPWRPDRVNLRVFQGDARALLSYLPSESIAKIFVLFPDPWPKRRHRKRRLIRPETLDALSRVMCDGGEVRFASDDPDYVRWTLDHFIHHGDFRWTARAPGDWRLRGDRRPADWSPTRYERKAIAAGRQCWRLVFRRRDRTGIAVGPRASKPGCSAPEKPCERAGIGDSK